MTKKQTETKKPSPAAAAKQAAQNATTPAPSQQHGSKSASETTPDVKPKTSEPVQNNLQSDQAPTSEPASVSGPPRPETTSETPAPTNSINLAVAPPPKEKERDKTRLQVFESEYSFDIAYKVARQLSKAKVIPDNYQGEENIPNCLVALEMSQRLNVSPLAVMQSLYIVHGKPGWTAQWVIASLNSCGLFSPLRFELSFNDNGEPIRCRAWARELLTGDRLDGPFVTMEMVMAEGWNNDKPLRSGNGVQKSKWNTMPEVMFRYRAASFFGKLYAPEIMMGLSTADEIHDVIDVTPVSGATFDDNQVGNEIDQAIDSINREINDNAKS